MSQLSSTPQPVESRREIEFYAFQIFHAAYTGTPAHFVRELRLRWDEGRGRIRWDEEPVQAFRQDHEALEWYLRRRRTLAQSGFLYPARWPAPLSVPEGCELIL